MNTYVILALYIFVIWFELNENLFSDILLDTDVKRDSGNHTQTTEFETTTTDTDSDDEFEQMRYVMITGSTETRPMKPFFIEIQNFWAWADKLGR